MPRGLQSDADRFKAGTCNEAVLSLAQGGAAGEEGDLEAVLRYLLYRPSGFLQRFHDFLFPDSGYDVEQSLQQAPDL
jgi:hypothetical protein